MTGSAPTTPKERRAQADAAASRALAASLDRHGISRARLAADAGVPEQHARAWADADVDRNISIARAACAPHLVRIDLAEHVAPPGCVVCVLPAPERIVDDVRHAANIARGGGVVLEKYLEATADGVLDRGEIADIRAALRDQLRALASLDMGLARAEETFGRAVVHAPRLHIAGGSR